MKDRVKTMYEEIRMPKHCEETILRAAGEKRTQRRKPALRPVLAAAAVLVLVICLAPPVWAAVENWVLRFHDPETGLTVYEGKTSKGSNAELVHVEAGEASFAEVRQGRLYFTGNGENLDITDEVADGKPYIYTYQDENGYTIYRIVGIAGTVENYGGYSFIKDEEGVWLSGEGHNYMDTQTGQIYPWVDAMWQELNIPWPKPAA